MTVVLGQDAKLPCFYRGDPGEQVGQVAWLRVDAGAAARELALLHSEYGLHVSAAYEGRVERPPLPRIPQDGAVLLRNAVQADEGEYECRVSTFPAGSFQARLRLRVLGERGCRAEAGRRGGGGRERQEPPVRPRTHLVGTPYLSLSLGETPSRRKCPILSTGNLPLGFCHPLGSHGPGLCPLSRALSSLLPEPASTPPPVSPPWSLTFSAFPGPRIPTQLIGPPM